MRTNNIFASFDADKVSKVLSGAVYNEERADFYKNMGITLENVFDVETALRLSGQDFEVKKLPVYHCGFSSEYDFTQVPEFFATVRSDTKQTLGIVGKDYQVLQNGEAFEFLNSLVAMGKAKFTSAGDFRKNGAASYIQMSSEPLDILGDTFDNYFMISNSHDGGMAITVCITPIRAWCKNTALIALRKATNKVTIKHTINMHNNLEKSKEILFASTKYLEALKEEAEKLAVKPFSKKAFEALCYRLYPIKEEASETVQIRNLAQIEHLFKAYQQDDLQNFNGSAWKVLQAVSDCESHPLSFRKTTKKADNGTQAFQNVVVYGMPLLNKAYDIIKESV